jgi:hypothetical protein
MSFDCLAVRRQHLRLKEDDIFWPLAGHGLNRDLITRMALAERRLLLSPNVLQRPQLDDRLVSRSAGIELRTRKGWIKQRSWRQIRVEIVRTSA